MQKDFLIALATTFAVFVSLTLLLTWMGLPANWTSIIPLTAAMAVVAVFYIRHSRAEKPVEKQMVPVEQPEPPIPPPTLRQHSIILTGANHGVLQDRLNNWLEGSYGRVTSSSLAVTPKGFFLTVFYEPVNGKA